MPRISREYERFAFAREMKRALVADVEQRAIDAGAFPADVTPDVVLRLLSAARSSASAVMRLSDRLAPGEDADALARDVLDVTLAGLRSRASRFDPSSADCAPDRSTRTLLDAHVS